jgi:hypothetical protein
MLGVPIVLNDICDVPTIHQIGYAYRRATNINSVNTLARSIWKLPTESGSVDSEAVAESIRRRIETDFQEDQVMLLEGWVLSLTEARQCALLSLIET